MGDAHCRPARAIGMADYAFMRDVEMFTVAVDHIPQSCR
jgi:hypothetical protein